MTTITESEIEKLAIELFKQQGYEYLYAPAIAPDGKTPERRSFEDVLFLHRLQTAVRRLNPTLSADVLEYAIKQMQRLNSPELISNNEAFHRLLTEGVKVTYQQDGHSRGDLVWLIDFNTPENNDFFVVNQYAVVEHNFHKRLDMVLFVNGLPLVVIELKNPADEHATIHSAFQQIQTYKHTLPTLFSYNGFLVISDGLEARAGTISSGFSRFMAWKSADGKYDASPLIGQLETLIKGMLPKHTLLDLIRHFIVFERAKHTDPETGVMTIHTEKKLAAYHQYYAVNRAVESTLRASGYQPHPLSPSPSERGKTPLPVGRAVKFYPLNPPQAGEVDPFPPACGGNKRGVTGCPRENLTALLPAGEGVGSPEVMEAPESYGLSGVSSQAVGDRKGGVVWHTQGSGKSLSMVFYAGKIVLAMENPTIVVITDRNDLDDQLFETLRAKS